MPSEEMEQGQTSSKYAMDCTGCSACCRAGIAIPLSKDEAHQLADAGTDMIELQRRENRDYKPGRGRKFYILISDCANLDAGGQCLIYDEKPRACNEFEVGGFVCSQLRHREGIDSVPVAIPTLKSQDVRLGT